MSTMRIISLDIGTSDLPYSSGSKDLILCSSERYWLELHRLLLMAPAHRYIRDCWEQRFDHGRDWVKRCKVLASYNNISRGKILGNWDDVVQYYCIMAMGGFSCFFDRWKLRSEHIPIEPDYEAIRGWHKTHREKEITLLRRNIYNFPTTKLDDNTLIYLHFPDRFAHYGCGYTWTLRKLEHASKELNSLANEGYKICVSYTKTRYGRVVNDYAEYFDPEIFRVITYPVLKASGDTGVSESYLVANLP